MSGSEGQAHAICLTAKNRRIGRYVSSGPKAARLFWAKLENRLFSQRLVTEGSGCVDPPFSYVDPPGKILRFSLGSGENGQNLSTISRMFYEQMIIL